MKTRYSWVHFAASKRFHAFLVSAAVAAACALAAATPQLAHAQSVAQPNSSGLTRAQVRQELIDLEGAGYTPGKNNIDYPNNLQAAQRRLHASK